jgi:hypothetical protein
MMAKVKGSLLVTAEAMEISGIAADSQNKAVGDFFTMKTEAERKHDRFYALPDLYTHQFSYGDFYAGFLYRSWPDFHANGALANIKQNTFQLIQSFSQCPMLENVASEDDFEQKELPHAHSGICNPQAFTDYVGDWDAWEEWHKQWYTTHPEDIDWSDAANGWLPRQDLIMAILKRELLVKFMEAYTEEKAKEMVAAIPDVNVVHEFHSRVMGHQGSKLAGYASAIGGEICRCNYYSYEAELSDLERQYAKSMREIYSILNKDGRRQFISIDFGHGMYEFHDENGEHQGEYRFDGSYNANKESSHNFKCMDQWHKQTGR